MGQSGLVPPEPEPFCLCAVGGVGSCTGARRALQNPGFHRSLHQEEGLENGLHKKPLEDMKFRTRF